MTARVLPQFQGRVPEHVLALSTASFQGGAIMTRKDFTQSAKGKMLFDACSAETDGGWGVAGELANVSSSRRNSVKVA